MSTNNPLGSLFNNLFGTTAAYNNAQYGKTGNAGIDFLRPGLDFMMGAYKAYQANPDGGGTAIAGLGNMVDGLGRRNFLNQQQQQAQAALQYQQMINAQKAADNRQYAQGSTGLNVSGFGDLPSAEILNQIRQSNQVGNNNKFLQGQPLQQADHGALDAGLMQDYMKRFGDIASANITQGQLGQYSSQGQNRSFGDVLPPSVTGGQALPPGAPALEPDPVTGAINGGISETGPYVNPMFQSNPYGIGVPNIGNLLTAQDQGLTAAQDAETNARGVTQLKETQRHNKASEGIDRINANAHMISAQHSGSGSSSNPYTALNGQQNYLDGQLKAIEQEMLRNGFIDKKTGQLKPVQQPGNDWFGNPPSQGAVAKFNQYQQLAGARQRLLGSITPMPTAGQGIQNIKTTGQNASQNLGGFAAWKAGKTR